VDTAGPNYRGIVLRALPNLKKLDNVDVTPEEVSDAMRGPAYEEPQQQQQFRYSSPENDVSNRLIKKIYVIQKKLNFMLLCV
jgi:hypothetical protein